MADKETTTRIKKWELNPISCELCGDDLGWSEGFATAWCDHCAKQEESPDDL